MNRKNTILSTAEIILSEKSLELPSVIPVEETSMRRCLASTGVIVDYFCQICSNPFIDLFPFHRSTFKSIILNISRGASDYERRCSGSKPKSELLCGPSLALFTTDFLRINPFFCLGFLNTILLTLELLHDSCPKGHPIPPSVQIPNTWATRFVLSGRRIWRFKAVDLIPQ